MADIEAKFGNIYSPDIEKYISLFDSIHDFGIMVIDMIRLKRKPDYLYDYTKELYFDYLRRSYGLPKEITLECSRLKLQRKQRKGPEFLGNHKLEKFYLEKILNSQSGNIIRVKAESEAENYKQKIYEIYSDYES